LLAESCRQCLRDQFFDVHHIAILWILGAGAGPEEALGLCTLGRKGLPTRPAEKFLILLVSEPGVGDGHPAAEAFEQSFLSGVSGGVELFVDLAIN